MLHRHQKVRRFYLQEQIVRVYQLNEEKNEIIKLKENIFLKKIKKLKV